MLRKFCKEYDLTPELLVKLPLSTIEDLTEEYIHAKKHIIAPKQLNVIYCAIKSWCLYNRKIKSYAQFRQIKFDKSSRKTRDKAMITKDILRKMLNCANGLREKVILALYGIHGLRPSLIPQLKIEDIYAKDIEITGKGVKLDRNAWITVKREYKGNKGNIDFPIILTSETSAWLEQFLNLRMRNGEEMTPKTLLVNAHSEDNVYRIVRKAFKAVGFEGRKYLLRHFAYKQLKLACEDYDLREWLMGHKGKISAIYDHEHYLTHEEITQYKRMINEKPLLIYGLNETTSEKVETLIKFARAITEISDSEIQALRNALKDGNLTIEQFETKIQQLVKEAMNKQIETRFEQLFIKYANKHGLNGNKR
jgi:integrase